MNYTAQHEAVFSKSKNINIKHKQRQQLPLGPTLGAETLETTETKS